jgi:hypothetical protein
LLLSDGTAVKSTKAGVSALPPKAEIESPARQRSSGVPSKGYHLTYETPIIGTWSQMRLREKFNADQGQR